MTILFASPSDAEFSTVVVTFGDRVRGAISCSWLEALMLNDVIVQTRSLRVPWSPYLVADRSGRPHL